MKMSKNNTDELKYAYTQIKRYTYNEEISGKQY